MTFAWAIITAPRIRVTCSTDKRLRQKRWRFLSRRGAEAPLRFRPKSWAACEPRLLRKMKKPPIYKEEKGETV